ncbi:MAG: hypothetical protein HLUCCO07_00630 [Rhodobacteraceae bacterium HLUCCO07]|nr:MAG: hypothetical protein HLUCCO07_00630 [Rhodobacteraceae bacterium HLUCCO07]
MHRVTFSCTCGSVAGQIRVASPAAGNHVVCHCPDCRTAELALGQPDPDPDGVAIWQTMPDCVQIEQGADRLAILRLSPKGLYRWHATCCGAPMFNTLRHPRLAFAGISAARLSDTTPLGPVTCHAFMAKPGGGYRHTGFNRAGLRILRMMLRANLSGTWRATPFFDAQGQPRADIRVLSRAERTALRQP